jgi:hypothetical protein
MSGWISNLISILVGALGTWIVAQYYYQRASKELATEAAELRRLNIFMLLGMEHAGWVKLSRDSAGKITGFMLSIAQQDNLNEWADRVEIKLE